MGHVFLLNSDFHNSVFHNLVYTGEKVLFFVNSYPKFPIFCTNLVPSNNGFSRILIVSILTLTTIYIIAAGPVRRKCLKRQPRYARNVIQQTQKSKHPTRRNENNKQKSPVYHHKKLEFQLADLGRATLSKHSKLDVKVPCQVFLKHFGFQLLQLPPRLIKKVILAIKGKSVWVYRQKKLLMSWLKQLVNVVDRKPDPSFKYPSSSQKTLWICNFLDYSFMKRYSEEILAYLLGMTDLKEYNTMEETKSSLSDGSVFVTSRMPFAKRPSDLDALRNIHISIQICAVIFLIVLEFITSKISFLFAALIISFCMFISINVIPFLILADPLRRITIAFGKNGVVVFGRYKAKNRTYHSSHGSGRFPIATEAIYNARILWGFSWDEITIVHYKHRFYAGESFLTLQTPPTEVIPDGSDFRESEVALKYVNPSKYRTGYYMIGIRRHLRTPAQIPRKYIQFRIFDDKGRRYYSSPKISELEFQTADLASWDLREFRDSVPVFHFVSALETCKEFYSERNLKKK